MTNTRIERDNNNKRSVLGFTEAIPKQRLFNNQQ